MSKLPLLVLFAGCCFAAAGPVCADGQIYRWVDAHGVTHFSDRPPVSRDVPVTVSPMPAAPAPDPRRQAEMRAWVAEVNRQVNQTIRQEQAYQLKRQAIAALSASQEARREAQAAPEQRFASVLWPYWGTFPVRHFRYWQRGAQRLMRPHSGMRGGRSHAPARPSFSLGRSARSADASVPLQTVPRR